MIPSKNRCKSTYLCINLYRPGRFAGRKSEHPFAQVRGFSDLTEAERKKALEKHRIKQLKKQMQTSRPAY